MILSTILAMTQVLFVYPSFPYSGSKMESKLNESLQQLQTTIDTSKQSLNIKDVQFQQDSKGYYEHAIIIYEITDK